MNYGRTALDGKAAPYCFFSFCAGREAGEYGFQSVSEMTAELSRRAAIRTEYAKSFRPDSGHIVLPLSDGCVYIQHGMSSQAVQIITLND